MQESKFAAGTIIIKKHKPETKLKILGKITTTQNYSTYLLIVEEECYVVEIIGDTDKKKYAISKVYAEQFYIRFKKLSKKQAPNESE